MIKPLLNLIVLRVSNLESSLRFYQALGLEFVQEQHGKGLVHYACELDNLVIELYPGKEAAPLNYKSAGATWLGFQVDSIDLVLELLNTLPVTILTPLRDTPRGRRILIQDPDGRAIELIEAKLAS
jgi:catechol 2,3-dioxygenase-like lactoylglutathione lyase family enzyme